MVMGDLGNSFKIRNIVFGISYAFNENSLCVLVYGRGKVLWLVSIDELGSYAQAWHEHLELIVRSSIYIGRRDDIISSMA